MSLSIDVFNSVLLLSIKLFILGGVVLAIVKRSRNSSASALHGVLCVVLFGALLLPFFPVLLQYLSLDIIPPSLAVYLNVAFAEYREGSWSYQSYILTLFGVYFFVAIWLLLYRLAGWCQMRQIIRLSMPLEKNEEAFHILKTVYSDFNHAASNKFSGDAFSINLNVSADINGPQTFGFLNPVILLPVEYDAWSKDTLKHVLMHELAHVQRKDWLIKNMAWLVVCLLWFIPSFWFVLRKINWYAEVACDDYITRYHHERAGYAESLVQLASDSHSCQTSVSMNASTHIIHGSDVYHRLQASLDGSRNRVALDTQQWCLMIFIFLVVCLPFSNFRVSAALDTLEEPINLMSLFKEDKPNGTSITHTKRAIEIVAPVEQSLYSPAELPEKLLNDAAIDTRIGTQVRTVQSLQFTKDNSELAMLDGGPDLLLPPIFNDKSVLVSRVEPKKMILPRYPNKALRKGIEGDVVVRFDVNHVGRVEQVSIVSSTSRIFEQPVIEAVKDFVFDPIRYDGEIIELRGLTETYNFRIKEEKR